jgi:hypothetical protein
MTQKQKQSILKLDTVNSNAEDLPKMTGDEYEIVIRE